MLYNTLEAPAILLPVFPTNASKYDIIGGDIKTTRAVPGYIQCSIGIDEIMGALQKFYLLSIDDYYLNDIVSYLLLPKFVSPRSGLIHFACIGAAPPRLFRRVAIRGGAAPMQAELIKLDLPTS